MLTRRELLIGAVAATVTGVAVTRRVAEADPYCLVQTPRWSDPATWGGVVPPPGAAVTLPGTVLLDVDAAVGSLSIPSGTALVFDPANTRTLQSSGNVVVEGALRMRPNGAAQCHTLRFVGVNEAAFVGGGMVPLATDVGLWVMNAGQLDLAGTPKSPWVRAQNVPATALSVPLGAAPVGWQAGDTVVITPTGQGNCDGYDRAAIAGVAGSTVSLSAPTKKAHPYVDLGGFGYGAEVLNLTRNVVIEGTLSGRSHVFISTYVPQHVEYVELRYLGPRQASGGYTQGVLGRYPFHLHMAGDGTRGSTFLGLVAHDCGQGGFVPHGSHGCTFTSCVVHDTYDKAFWWDIGHRSNNTLWDSCVASLIRSDPAFRGYDSNGFTLGDGDGNAVRDCTCVGVQGNGEAGGFLWPEKTSSNWTVERIVSHNNKRNGLRVWQNHNVPHLIRDFVAAHNGHCGLSHGAYVNPYRYQNGWLADNGTTALALHASCSDGPATLGFDAVVFRGKQPILLPQHTLLGARPVEFVGCRFEGNTGTTATSVASVAAYPDLLDFVECGPVTVTWNAYSVPTSVIRWQHAGQSARLTPAGTTSISPFSTRAVPTPAPFAVLGLGPLAQPAG